MIKLKSLLRVEAGPSAESIRAVRCQTAGVKSLDKTHIALTRLQRDQSLVAVVGDSDNSLSMRSVKLGSKGAMNHAAGAGGGLHSVTTN